MLNRAPASCARWSARRARYCRLCRTACPDRGGQPGCDGFHLTGPERPQGRAEPLRHALNTLPEAPFDRRCHVVLDGVQDPGNVGTILRTADAFWCDGIFLVNGCADLYSLKTVRFTMVRYFAAAFTAAHRKRWPIFSDDLPSHCMARLWATTRWTPGRLTPPIRWPLRLEARETAFCAEIDGAVAIKTVRFHEPAL